MVRGTQVSTETRAAPNEAYNAPGTAHIHVISFNPHNLQYRSHHIHFSDEENERRQDKGKYKLMIQNYSDAQSPC